MDTSQYPSKMLKYLQKNIHDKLIIYVMFKGSNSRNWPTSMAYAHKNVPGFREETKRCNIRHLSHVLFVFSHQSYNLCVIYILTIRNKIQNLQVAFLKSERDRTKFQISVSPQVGNLVQWLKCCLRQLCQSEQVWYHLQLLSPATLTA